MPVPASINDLSTTAGSNYPAGSESPETLDDYQRAHASFIAQLRDGKQAIDALLTAIAALTTANGKFMAFTGVDTVAVRDIVGTVSDSGGLPNGALFETGSNANGRYVRFADGTQICWASSITTGATPNIATGSIFMSNTLFWSYPAQFDSGSPIVPYIQPTVVGWWTQAVHNNSTTQAAYRAFAAVSGSGTTWTAAGFAIGRWK